MVFCCTCTYSSSLSECNVIFFPSAGGLFSGRKQGVPVKFSLDSDLSEGECRKLLNSYTPVHMKANKATQKLFIK